MSTLNEQLDQLLAEVEKIPKDKKYWLIRTQSGDLYETFLENNFIALEHEHVTLTELSILKKEAADKEDVLVKLIKKRVLTYIENKNEKNQIDDEIIPRKTSLIASQIFKFAYQIKKGDIVIIPSTNSDFISFGEIEESHIANLTVKEKANIDTNGILKKRVKWLKEIARKELDPYLYKMFQAHQALNSVDNYAEIIERSLRDFYIIGDEAHIIINVATEDDIMATDLFGLGYDLLSLIDAFAKEHSLDISSKDLQVSLNLNSPGKIDLKSSFKRTSLVAGLILLLAGGGYKGGKIGDLTTEGLPGIIRAIDSFLGHQHDRETKSKLLERYQDSLNVKTPEDMNKLLKQFSDNKDLPK